MTIAVSEATSVSGLLQCPRQFKAGLVFAHGAGAGMDHPFMVAVADVLAALKIATLRFQFPFIEKHANRPDPPALCHATIRAAVCAAQERWPSVPLFAGGKSFGGRMISQAQAITPLPGVRGIAFLGFPLHPPKQPSDVRAQHLSKIDIPLLFLQGTRDVFAEMDLLQPLATRLGPRTTLIWVQDADHSFHVLARTRRSHAQVQSDMLTALSVWIDSIIDRGLL